MYDKQHIYKLLNFENDVEIREEGIRLANDVKDLSFLIMPPAEPSVWECCAEILCSKSDSVLEPYLDEILKWLQDLNWPGASIILNRLKNYSGEKLKKPFLKCFTKAINLNNEHGLMWLDYLSELLDNKQLAEELPEKIVEKLQEHYKNWGFWYDNS